MRRCFTTFSQKLSSLSICQARRQRQRRDIIVFTTYCPVQSTMGKCIHALLRAAYFSKSFLQDALQRRDDRGSQTEKQQDGHNALRRPDITGHQCSSPTSYIYYAEPVIEPVISLCRAGHRTSLAMFLLSCQLMPFMNFLHQCPCILVSSPSACVKLQMQSSCTGEDTSGAYSGAIHPRATYLGSCLHCAGDTERLMLLVLAFLDIEAVLCNF